MADAAFPYTSSPLFSLTGAELLFSVPIIHLLLFVLPELKKRRMKIMFEIDSISDTSLMHRKLLDGQKQAAP